MRDRPVYDCPWKKNWLFMGDADAGERGAILYTVIESSRRRGIDPYGYLKDALTRLPKMTFACLCSLWPFILNFRIVKHYCPYQTETLSRVLN